MIPENKEIIESSVAVSKDITSETYLLKMKDFTDCPFEVSPPILILRKKYYYVLLHIKKKDNSVKLLSLSITQIEGCKLHYKFGKKPSLQSDRYFTMRATTKYKPSFILIKIRDGRNQLFHVLFKTNGHGIARLKFIKIFPYESYDSINAEQPNEGLSLEKNISPSPLKKCHIIQKIGIISCPKCGNTSISTKMIRYKDKPRYYKTNYCKNCNIYYVALSDFYDHFETWFVLNPEEIRLLQEKSESDRNNNISAQDFLIRLGVLKCRKKNHQLQDIQAIIPTIDRTGNIGQISVPAGYCPICKMYFILESVYQTVKCNGIPLCRVIDNDSYISISGNNKHTNNPFGNFSSESILRQYGYNVNQQDDLSEIQRRRILSAIIDYRILTKSEVISYLDSFINLRKNQRNLDGTLRHNNALNKWKADRCWITKYRKGSFIEVYARQITKNK